MSRQRLSMLCSVTGSHGACYLESCECDCHRTKVRFMGQSPHEDSEKFFAGLGYELWVSKKADPTLKISPVVEKVFSASRYPVDEDFVLGFTQAVLMMVNAGYWSLREFLGELERQKALSTPTLF